MVVVVSVDVEVVVVVVLVSVPGWVVVVVLDVVVTELWVVEWDEVVEGACEDVDDVSEPPPPIHPLAITSPTIRRIIKAPPNFFTITTSLSAKNKGGR